MAVRLPRSLYRLMCCSPPRVHNRHTHQGRENVRRLLLIRPAAARETCHGQQSYQCACNRRCRLHRISFCAYAYRSPRV
eukprot:4478053-Pleurochrysis_carterae.AAC.2